MDDDDTDTTEIPASKSVPPHVPPSRVVNSERDLPSVIVDLKELEVEETARASEVDGLLVAVDCLTVEVAAIGEIVEVPYAPRGEATRRSILRARPSRAAALPKVAIALAAALSAAGATFAGLKVSHVSPAAAGAAMHFTR